MLDTRNKKLIGKVRTREAPSPTGYPHVGTAFQVLFNWVFARRYQGKFILRIEDTDRKRYVEGSEETIHEALDWLALNPDESPKVGGPYAPYRQSERLAIYQKYAQELIDKDKAYYCFCSAERLAKMRKQQQKEGIPPKYDRKCRSLTKKEVEEHLSKGEKAVIRLKVPDDQKIIVHDVLRGEVEFDSNIVDDQVLLKSDAFPTYHLAVVVDDHLMEITHMKRGEEWLPSAPKHILLYEYFGWQPPVMLHTPVLRNPDRSKLSKRKGNTSLWWYREQGYLADALLNFLALLLWKPADQREIFTKEEMMEIFEWEQLNITGPIFDTKKLNWLNGIYIRKKELDLLFKEIQSWAEWVAGKGSDEKIIDGAKRILEWIAKDADFFKNALALAQERLKVFSELHDLLDFYYLNKLVYDLEDLLQGHDKQTIIEILIAVKERLENLTDYNPETWEATIRKCADDFDFKHKDLFMSLRSAITARKFTPPLYELMEVLGKDKSFSRIETAIRFLKTQ
ncbi:MAG: glutamate--tRNA ligase [Candidatus Woesebacteria bacterium]|jgi:glutamyl-tRNA synthetase